MRCIISEYSFVISFIDKMLTLKQVSSLPGESKDHSVLSMPAGIGRTGAQVEGMGNVGGRWLLRQPGGSQSALL